MTMMLQITDIEEVAGQGVRANVLPRTKAGRRSEKRSALHVPTQRGATADAPQCIRHCTAVRFMNGEGARYRTGRLVLLLT